MIERKTLLGGRYELDQVIGRGGMAEVWRARDARLQRDVAVKRLRVDLASDPTFQARFRREAHSAAGLNHPNIVAVYDTGEQVDSSSDVSVPYIVMELVEGVTLRDVLRDGRKVVPERALEFAAGVLDALAYSHRAGIIHRDIKPANVMLTPSGAVKVMDFGIARAVADTSATMTQTAAVIGTAQYLSPEQARGEKVDNRSDLYSVGCLLYELLTSEPPFKGDSPVSVAYQHVREQPQPPSRVDPEITPAMDAVVLKALEKDRADRYQDAREFRDDILRIVNGQPVHAVARTEDGVPTAVLGGAAAGAAAGEFGATRVARAGTGPQRAASPTPAPSPIALSEEEPEERKSRAGGVILGILTALVLVGMGVALFLIFGDREPEVEMATVPTVTNSERAIAENMLTNEGFVPVVEFRSGTDEDEGLVVEQNPTGQAEAERGSEVTIWVSTGPDRLVVPNNLLGMQEADAIEALVAADFERSQITTQEHDPATEPIDAVAGSVTEVSPASGASVPLEQPITLTVATGRSLVPRLVFMPLSEAQNLAEDAGFVLSVNEVETDEHIAGHVFSQSPEQGEPMVRGESIEVDVAVAPEPEPSPDPTTEEPEPTETATEPEETPTQDPTDEPTDEETPPEGENGEGGNSGPGGTPPGQGGNPPGQGGNPPGQGGNPPGQGGNPPGQGGNPPGGGNN